MRNYTNSIKVFDGKLPTLSYFQFLTQLKIQSWEFSFLMLSGSQELHPEEPDSDSSLQE